MNVFVGNIGETTAGVQLCPVASSIVAYMMDGM